MMVETILLHNEIFWRQDGSEERSMKCTHWRLHDWVMGCGCCLLVRHWL